MSSIPWFTSGTRPETSDEARVTSLLEASSSSTEPGERLSPPRLADSERESRLRAIAEQQDEMRRLHRPALSDEEEKDEADFRQMWGEWTRLLYDWSQGQEYPMNKPRWPKHWAVAGSAASSNTVVTRRTRPFRVKERVVNGESTLEKEYALDPAGEGEGG